MTDSGRVSVEKPLFWVGSSHDAILGLPDEVKDEIGFALSEAQFGSKHVSAKPLLGFGGAGVLEVVSDFDGSTYRGVYTVKFAGAVYVLHVFQKKAKKGAKAPKHEIDLVKQRLKAAAAHYEEWIRENKQEKK
jgi:phage-related protein